MLLACFTCGEGFLGRYFVLCDFLLEDSLVEFKRLLLVHCVVYLTFSWLDKEGLFRIASIWQTVRITFCHISTHEFLMFPRSILLLHKALCGRFVLLWLLAIDHVDDLAKLFIVSAYLWYWWMKIDHLRYNPLAFLSVARPCHSRLISQSLVLYWRFCEFG